jgi:hypothetical protein
MKNDQLVVDVEAQLEDMYNMELVGFPSEYLKNEVKASELKSQRLFVDKGVDWKLNS